MSVDLKDLAGEILDWVKPRLKGGEAEIYLSRAEERGVELREGRLDGVQQSAAEGMGLRVLKDARQGFAAAGGADLKTAQRLWERVREEMPFVEPDGHRDFPAASKGGSDAALSKTLWDDSLFTAPWTEIAPRLEKASAAALKEDKRVGSVIRAGYGESRGEAVIASTKGVMSWERGGSASVGFSALAEGKGEHQTGSSFKSSRRAADLDFDAVAREAAQRTVALLGAEKSPTGTRSVVFDPWVAGELLELIAGLLCADQVQRGKSLLAGKLGKKIGSELLTFIDDPRLSGGLASSLYDDEGQLTRKKTMIEKGVVKDFFYDTYTANRAKRQSNASAGRGSYKGLPSPGSSNFYLEPGSQSRESILSSTKDGVLVLDIIGMHMADSISGEFSVGVSGIAIKDGKLSNPVKGAMISGNLVELLERVDAVGSDLTFHGSLGAPTFRVSRLSVA